MTTYPWEQHWRRALDEALRVLLDQGAPASAAELASCTYPPRVLELRTFRTMTRSRWMDLRRALLCRLIGLGWSERGIAAPCHFDPKTIVATRRALKETSC